MEQQVCFKDPAEGSVDIRFVEDYDAEMDEIVASVRSVVDAGGAYGDVAILVRGNQEGAEIAARLVSERIPVVSDDSLFVKSSVTVRRLVSQLSLVDAPDSEGRASPTPRGALPWPASWPGPWTSASRTISIR